MADILIKDGFVVTMDERRRIIPHGSILIEENRIAQVGEADEIKTSESEYVIDARNHVVLPGFVNVHTHLPSIFVRGVYGVVTEGLYEVLFPVKTYFKPEDIYLFGLASCAEAIYAGSTTIVESYNHMSEFSKAAEETGIRAILGEQIVDANLMKIKDNVYEYLPDQAEECLKRGVDLVERYQGKEGRISTIIAPLAPDMTTRETYLRCKEVADKHGLSVTTHLSQSWKEVRQVKRTYGKTPLEHLASIGLLDRRLSCAHCTYITDREKMLMREAGAKILHCPRPYALSGTANPLTEPMDMGIPIGLGTDNVFHSMNETIRAALYASRFRAQALDGYGRMAVEGRPTSLELLELATIRGSEAMGIDCEVGSLEPGKKADLITFDLMKPHLTPTMDPLSSVVLYASSSDIDTVIVEGEVLKKEGVLTKLDMNTILESAQRRTNEIWSTFFNENPESRRIWTPHIPYETNN